MSKFHQNVRMHGEQSADCTGFQNRSWNRYVLQMMAWITHVNNRLKVKMLIIIFSPCFDISSVWMLWILSSMIEPFDFWCLIFSVVSALFLTSCVFFSACIGLLNLNSLNCSRASQSNTRWAGSWQNQRNYCAANEDRPVWASAHSDQSLRCALSG